MEKKMKSELENALLQAKTEWDNNKTNVTAYSYANLLFENSDFWEARNIIEPYAASDNVSAEILFLAGKLNQILGNFQTAENYLKKVGDEVYNDEALHALLLTYYQQNDCVKIKSLPFPDDYVHPAKGFASILTENPYKIEWENEDKVSRIPFLTTDFSPVVIFEINGVPMPLLFDTGADTLILDPEIAERLNVYVDKSSIEGTFGGGLAAEMKLGAAEKVKLGAVYLRNVPVTILPVKHFSSIFSDKGIVLAGIFGTGFLRQFTSTVNYEEGQLILRERGAIAMENVRASLSGKEIVEIPFALDDTHYMFAQGNINGISSLNFFVDSGFAHENIGFTLPLQTLEYLGIPEPERKALDTVGGGGGAWETGTFTVDSIGLGTLVQENEQGEYGAFPPQLVSDFGYFCDGLISHNFLRKYESWTLDFENMVYLFSKRDKMH
jgi:hypothetical protein